MTAAEIRAHRLACFIEKVTAQRIARELRSSGRRDHWHSHYDPLVATTLASVILKEMSP
jgi:hypothetical protein